MGEGTSQAAEHARPAVLRAFKQTYRQQHQRQAHATALSMRDRTDQVDKTDYDFDQSKDLRDPRIVSRQRVNADRGNAYAATRSCFPAACYPHYMDDRSARLHIPTGPASDMTINLSNVPDAPSLPCRSVNIVTNARSTANGGWTKHIIARFMYTSTIMYPNPNPQIPNRQDQIIHLQQAPTDAPSCRCKHVVHTSKMFRPRGARRERSVIGVDLSTA